MLHRQQAPELGHSTQLNVSNDGGRILRRMVYCSIGWGGKGSGLGLLNCVEMEEGDLLSKEEEGEGWRGAGEVLFQACVGKNHVLVKTEVGWDEMYETTVEKEGTKEEKEPTEKRRKVAASSEHIATDGTDSSSRKLKSTSQLFRECLNDLHQQLNDDKMNNQDPSSNNNADDTSISLPPEQQFALLTQIRLARAFHTTPSRHKAIEYRLRSIICLLSSQPDQDVIGAFFGSQPELVGEIVDLVRPTVSGGSIGGSAKIDTDNHTKKDASGSPTNDSILVLANSPRVPYHIRTLAIEALTALVARRDSTGNMSAVARQVNVLPELGVGKGQYSGLLPTLIRYSLAALNSFLICDAASSSGGGKSEESDGNKDAEKELDLGQELGMIFLQSTKAPELPRKEREERALEFIDSVLTLTSAVVSVPSGTTALTDCGIIPALVSTIALDSQIVQKRTAGGISSSLFVGSDDNDEKESYSECVLKYITAQAIQILEGAIVTHTNALSAFHELKGVDILVQRLNLEMKRVMQVKAKESSSDDVIMEDADEDGKPRRNLQAARRVLLFSAVNCLTVVFHQQEANGSNATIPSGAAQLRKPELLLVLMDILDNADSYGAVLAGLVSTLLSDVINADPQVVHHVHESGLAKSFLSLLMGKNNEMKQVIGDHVENWGEVEMEPSSELVMAFPNLILALSLTESGAKSIKELNPFPALLSVFCSPRFAMPNSRSLLNEMAAIVGTGLDEIMRHNPIHLKPIVVKAVVQVMNRIAYIGKELTMREESNDTKSDDDFAEEMTSRTYFVQYCYNIALLLEQILQNEDHVPLFLNEGGVDALLKLAPYITPAGQRYINHLSCLSSPSIGSVAHANLSTSFGAIVKTIASHSDSHKIMKKITGAIEVQFGFLLESIDTFRDGIATGTAVMGDGDEGTFSFSNLLESIPAGEQNKSYCSKWNAAQPL